MQTYPYLSRPTDDGVSDIVSRVVCEISGRIKQSRTNHRHVLAICYEMTTCPSTHAGSIERELHRGRRPRQANNGMAPQRLPRGVHTFGCEISWSIRDVERCLPEEWDVDCRSTVNRLAIQLQLHTGCVRVCGTSIHVENRCQSIGRHHEQSRHRRESTCLRDQQTCLKAQG